MTNEPSQYATRRRYRRCSFEGKIMLFHDGRLQFGTAVQLSEGGILVQVESIIQVDESVEMNFILPDGHFISVIGKVLYVIQSDQRRQIGLSFSVIPILDREKIGRFVNQSST